LGTQLAPDRKSVEKWPLPAPFSPEFLRLGQEWLEQVGRWVIQPHQAPHGPIVAIQIGNEGIYSNGQHAPWQYDYSPSGLSKYSEFLKSVYRSIENYNSEHKTAFATWEAIPAPRKLALPEFDWRAGYTGINVGEKEETPASRKSDFSPQNGSLNALNALNDWGAFVAQYMNEIYGEWSRPLGTSLPVLVNQNPPMEASFGLDAWLTRVEPERWQGIHYGITNWVGDVSANPSAFDRYILTAKRYPGPNMEENWGFAELYDPAYVDSAISFYQTLLILNNGATGFNIYTGVGTSHADQNLDIIRKVPYPDAAPISADGSPTPKAEIVHWMAKFFEHYGEEFLICRPLQPVAWGLYLPHARAAVWSPDGDTNHPQHGKYLKEFQTEMRRLHLDYGLVNLQTASVEDLLRFSFVFLAGGSSMSPAVQQTLADYALAGGYLVFLRQTPYLDDKGVDCNILRSTPNLISLPNADYAPILQHLPRPELIDGEADVWVRSHPKDDLHFITILIPAQGKSRVVLSLPVDAQRRRLSLSATPSGGAILRLKNGWITDIIVKGYNAYLGCSVIPQCSLDSQTVGLDKPGDYARIGDWIASLDAQPPIGEKNPSQR
jgi:beta-galactosidase